MQVLPDSAGSSASDAPRGRILLAAACIVGTVFAAYGNSLHAPFVFDDIPGIVENPTIRDLGDLGTVLSGPSDIGSSANSRPLVNLTLALNYAAGGLDPFGYHLFNIALHALAALALFGLVRRTCLLPSLRARLGAASLPIGFGASLLWAVHPLQTETVTCTIQRTEGLVGLFYLLVFYGFVRAVGDSSDSGRRWGGVISVGACLLGVFSKEVMATAPVMLLLYDRTFAAGSFGAAWRQRRGLHLATAASWIPLAWLVLGSAGRGGTVGFGLRTTVWEYVLTQCKALVLYVRLSIWPHPLVMDYGTDVAVGIGDIWLQAVLLLILLAATIVALKYRPMAGFFGAWFFVILAPSSSVVPLQTQTIAEHRMYLSLAAVIVPLVAWLWLCAGRRAWAVVAAVAVAFGALTARRNADYGTVVGIWADTVAKQPENPRALLNLFLESMTEGRVDELLILGEKVAATYPDNSKLHVNYGTVLFRAGRVQEAANEYETAVRLSPRNPEAHFNLGNLKAQSGLFAEAKAHFEISIQEQPSHLAARTNLGHTLTSLGQLPLALEQFREAKRLAPNDPDVNFRLGNALAEMGQLEAAVALFEEALRLQPGHPGAVRNLTQARQMLGQR